MSRQVPGIGCQVPVDSDLPPFDRSQMDGYAVRAADTQNTPVRLRIVGESVAGAGWHDMEVPLCFARFNFLLFITRFLSVNRLPGHSEPSSYCISHHCTSHGKAATSELILVAVMAGAA